MFSRSVGAFLPQIAEELMVGQVLPAVPREDNPRDENEFEAVHLPDQVEMLGRVCDAVVV